MLTTMGIVARTLQVDISGATATVEKEMTSTQPRKIRALSSKIHVPRAVSPESQLKLERAALSCPVKLSVDPDIEMPIEFIWKYL